jgi:hypothetical protein
LRISVKKLWLSAIDILWFSRYIWAIGIITITRNPFLMRPILFISMILVCFFGNRGNGQSIKTYPIPSFNVVLTGMANFREQLQKGDHGLTEGKKTMSVTSSGISQGSAQVWIYSLDGLTILGPYTLNPGETIMVEIDDRAWGVLCESAGEVILSVWIEEISTPSPEKAFMPPHAQNKACWSNHGVTGR